MFPWHLPNHDTQSESSHMREAGVVPGCDMDHMPAMSGSQPSATHISGSARHCLASIHLLEEPRARRHVADCVWPCVDAGLLVIDVCVIQVQTSV